MAGPPCGILKRQDQNLSLIHISTGTVIVAGEIRTQAYVDVQEIARGVIRRIGYNRAKFGFDCDTCGVMSLIHEQSPDIAQGVDESFETDVYKRQSWQHE